MKKYAFEIVMAASVIAGVIVLAATARSQPTFQWPSDGGPAAWTIQTSGGNWIVQATGPNYNPIYIRDGRRVYIVSEDGGVKRCH